MLVCREDSRQSHGCLNEHKTLDVLVERPSMTFLGEPGYALLLDPPGIRQNFHQVDDVLELVCPRLHEAPR